MGLMADREITQRFLGRTLQLDSRIEERDMHDRAIACIRVALASWLVFLQKDFAEDGHPEPAKWCAVFESKTTVSSRLSGPKSPPIRSEAFDDYMGNAIPKSLPVPARS